MPDETIAPARFNELVDKEGKPTQRNSEYMESATRQINFSRILTGSGNPEGKVTAIPTRLYMDSAGSTGSILYIKKTGNNKAGWVLV